MPPGGRDRERERRARPCGPGARPARPLRRESLRAKLERAGVSETAQTEAVEALERAGYVDDARFARDRAAVLAGRGYGDDWIRADLEAQGVAAEAAEAALAALEPEAERAAERRRRLGGGPRAVARTLGPSGLLGGDARERACTRTLQRTPDEE